MELLFCACLIPFMMQSNSDILRGLGRGTTFVGGQDSKRWADYIGRHPTDH